MSKVTIRPRGENEKGGFLCMPLQSNIPMSKNPEWKAAECPMCGAECWTSARHERLVKEQGVTAVCTMCALKEAARRKDG